MICVIALPMQWQAMQIIGESSQMQFPKRKRNTTTSNYFPKLLMFPYPPQITCCERWTPLNKLQYLKKELELPPPIRIRSRPLYCSWHKSAREPKPLGHWRLRGPQSTNFWRGLQSMNVEFLQSVSKRLFFRKMCIYNNWYIYIYVYFI